MATAASKGHPVNLCLISAGLKKKSQYFKIRAKLTYRAKSKQNHQYWNLHFNEIHNLATKENQ